MKYFYLFIFLLFTSTVFAQSSKPAPTPKSTTTNQVGTSLPKDSVVYMTPTGFEFDTIQIYAILVDLKTPLGVSSYNVISKNWTYEDGKKQLAEQWLETGAGVKINEWRKKLLWYINRADWKD